MDVTGILNVSSNIVGSGTLAAGATTIGGNTAITGATDITGDLDVDNININGNSITSTDTNGDINITPNGTGSVVIDGLSFPQQMEMLIKDFKTDGSGNISFANASSSLGSSLSLVNVGSAWDISVDSNNN